MKIDVHTEVVTYRIGDETHKGYLATPNTTKKTPGIVIAPAWKGLDRFAREKAVALAELGYVAMAADLYGEGVVADTDDEAAALMMPLFKDRLLLQKRVRAALDTLQENPLVDKEKLAAIGFCFGGLTAIELFRSGAPVRGVVSFHGLLGPKLGDNEAATVALAKGIEGKILVLHGHDDPLVSTNDIVGFQKEMTDAKIDWQMHVYGLTSHAFTNPEANDLSMGLIYNSVAARRSWQSMKNFFEEVFT